MRLSSVAMVGIVGFVMGEHGPQDVAALTGEGDDGLDVMLSLAPLAVVVGSAIGMDAEGAEGALIEDALEVPTAAACATERSGVSGLPQSSGPDQPVA